MDLKRIVQKVASLALDAGSFIQRERENFDSANIEFKDHSSNLVSYVDKETEKMLVKGLQQIIPDSGFITEEETVKQEIKEYVWLIDPLDGTTNFLHNVPIYCTSIGLMHNNEIVAGVIYDMNRKECFHAYKGGGAFMNDKKIHVSDSQTLSTSLIATGFPFYHYDKIDAYINVLKDLMGGSHGLRRCGSAAIDLAWVACGRFDGYFEYSIHSWDIAAGSIIVREAGGTVSDFKGGEDFIFGRNILATGGNIHKEVCDIVIKNWFE